MKVICYCFHDDKSKFSFNNIRSQSLLSSKCLWITKRNLCFYFWQNSSKGIQKPEDAKLCHLVCLLIFKLFFKMFIFLFHQNSIFLLPTSSCENIEYQFCFHVYFPNFFWIVTFIMPYLQYLHLVLQWWLVLWTLSVDWFWKLKINSDFIIMSV